jgi:transposase
MSTSTAVSIGVGFDTARYGHHVSFLREDLGPAAKAFTFQESRAGYEQLRQALERLQEIHGNVHFHMRIDAAGQYAANLERYLRSLPFDKTLSVGQPKRNRDYRLVHFPKRKADSVESYCCGRFALVERPRPAAETPAAFVQLRDLVAAVESEVKQTTRFVNQLHNRLARAFPELARVAPDLSAAWVLRLLSKYPTPAKIAAAHRDSLTKIPFLTEARAQEIQTAARETVASVDGSTVEALIRHSVRAVWQSRTRANRLKHLMAEAFDALPEGGHQQLITITGIGRQTAAALAAKVVSIDRFATPSSLVNYFGVFPEESTSGTDKFGRPIPPGTMRMSPKGNDLVRRLLWNSACVAIRLNPTIRALFRRQRQRGKRGDVALGHCMQKLVHLVYAVWTTNSPFVARQPNECEVAETAPEETKNAEGRKGQSPDRQAVTPAPKSVPHTCCESSAKANAPARRDSARLDFAELRRQVSMEQVLRALNWWDCLKGPKVQRRGPCPLHEAAGAKSRSFSVNLEKNIFQCFDAKCGAKGNVLDLWAKKQGMGLPEAARDLANRLGINQEQRRGTRTPSAGAKGTRGGRT